MIDHKAARPCVRVECPPVQNRGPGRAQSGWDLRSAPRRRRHRKHGHRSCKYERKREESRRPRVALIYQPECATFYAPTGMAKADGVNSIFDLIEKQKATCAEARKMSDLYGDLSSADPEYKRSRRRRRRLSSRRRRRSPRFLSCPPTTLGRRHRSSDHRGFQIRDRLTILR